MLKIFNGQLGNFLMQIFLTKMALQATLGLAKWGRTEAVFHLFVFQFGFCSGWTLLI
ncbi:MAG TPA: hypothetical protein VFN30_04505 [Chitinophagaceae bacterium]|nr:hypothetical protein [Chitinophagaceae bacterium]